MLRFCCYIDSSFDYFDKSLIALSVASFATVIGAPVGIVRSSFSFVFSIFAETQKKKKKLK